MGKYAKGTSVPVERSRAEIERILVKYGSDQYASGLSKEKAVVQFRASGRYVCIEMPLPQLEKNVSHYYRKKGHFYSEDAVAQESRRRWRALALYVKAKLESVESGIVSFEDAFLAHLVLPNGQTMGEYAAPQIAQAYHDGSMPKALPGY